MSRRKNKSKKRRAPERDKRKPLWRRVLAYIWKVITSIWGILTGRTDTGGEMGRTALSTMISFALNMTAVLLALFGVLGFHAAFTDARNFISSGLIAGCALSALIFAVVLRGFAVEMDRETDRNYLIAVFSGLTSMAALIVALAALART